MAVTNEFERDLINTSFLKRPGRVDMIVFQNVADAGDGSPGLQRAFRNYLHEGGIEADLDLVGNGIKGTSVNLTNAKLQEFNNIGATTISSAQWVYVGGADQPVKIADSVQFGGLALTGNLTLAANSITGTSVTLTNAKLQEFSNIGANTISGTQWAYVGALNQGLTTTSNVAFSQITMSGNIIMGSDDITFTAGGLVDGVDVSDFKTDYDTHKASTGLDHTYINQDLKTSFSPVFVGLTLSADLTTTSTIDGIDVSAIKLNSMPTAADGDIDANTQKIINVVNPTNDQDVATKIYARHSIASDDLIFSNDTERADTQADYTILKEITVYRSMKLRIYWQHKSGGFLETKTRVYINGVATGSEHANSTTSYVAFTEDIEVNTGDLIQIYGHYTGGVTPCYVKFMRIKGIEYVSNPSY